MFKIESYVTPILLSYVDKYVRDFKPADAQVSLWGGGVALHNLVLKPDVLQKEVALPFTLISGRIHELLIQVPWTKIMSEPIVVTIDTIECILSLRPPTPLEEGPPPDSPSHKAQVVEAPPGYMQALVRRIVSNITLRVHHLIVKYVQDDIVLSLNVKHLSVDAAGPDWEPAFADIDQNVPLIRRLVRLDDFTLCLDHCDADGKIRFYQEPLLYRCQIDLRVLTRLVSANTRRAKSLSVQLRSSKLAWGVTSDQLTLLLRLLKERTLEVKSPQPATNLTSKSQSQTPLRTSSSSNTAEPARSESWSEWAWSWMPTWKDREGGIEETPQPATCTPIYFVAFFDDVSLIYKVMETDGFNRKRARGILELQAKYAAVKTTVNAPTLISTRIGTRSFIIQSHGKCACGYLNYNASINKPTVYVAKMQTEEAEEAFVWPEEDFSDNVETAEAVDEKFRDDGKIENPDKSNLRTQSTETFRSDILSGFDFKPIEGIESFWTKMAPLIYLEFLHERSPPTAFTNPYDNPPKDFQYSDWDEENSLNISLQPMEIWVSMDLIHRLESFWSLYQEQAVVVSAETPRTLTVEERDALYENLPQRRINLDLRGLRLRLEPWDHSLSDKAVPINLVLDLDLPKAKVAITSPLYPRRVCSAACQMPETGPLWQGARLHITATFPAIEAKICTPSDGISKSCARADLKFVIHLLLNQQFFTKKQSVLFSYTLKAREVNISGSTARLMAAFNIPLSLIKHKVSLELRYTSLPRDAIKDEESVALDATFEDFAMRGYLTNNVKTHIVTLQSTRATLIHATEGNEPKQAWLFSVRDVPSTTPFLRMAVQWCAEQLPDSVDYLGIWTEPIDFCVDPLFIAWLAYTPTLNPTSDIQSQLSMSRAFSSSHFMRRRPIPSVPSSSGRGGSRSGSGAELVHVRPRSVESSSEVSDKKDKPPPQAAKPVKALFNGEQMIKLHERLRHILINVELGLVVVYVTMTTASAVDCATPHMTMERHVTSFNQVLAINIGRWNLHSSSATKDMWQEIRHDGPTFFTPKTEQTPAPGAAPAPAPADDDRSFPWKLKLADVACYSMEVHAGVDQSGREKSSSGLRSQLKTNPSLVQLNTILELVTTTVTLSVVTKAMQYKTFVKKPDRKKTVDPTKEEKKMKYFTSGTDFRPTTLKEFVRGPAKRTKSSADQTEPIVQDTGPDLKITSGPIVSFGFHVHADTPPVIVRLEQDQVHTVAAAIHCFRHIVALLGRPLIVPKGYVPAEVSQKSFIRSVSEMDEQQSLSESARSESRSELIPIFDPHAERDGDVNISAFFWFQWVISRCALVVATYEVKLAFDVDDIISTIDLQEHYNQVKLKLASASVKHYEKNENDEWKPGALGGRVLEAREPMNAKQENNFLCITITQAQISNLPDSWKEELHPKLLQQKSTVDRVWEIYVTLAPLEAVLQPSIVENIISLVNEMKPRAYCSLPTEVTRSSTWQWPFCYLSAGGLRLLVTCNKVQTNTDDTLMFILGKITANPHPENPICRRPINACDAGWVTADGGFEGRQYEMLFKSVAIRSAQFLQLVNRELSETMSINSGENPAHKWSQPIVAPVITPILHSLDVGCVLAPAQYVADAVVYGPGIELNLMSDCAIELSIDQMVLVQNVIRDMEFSYKQADLESEVDEDEKKGICPYASMSQVNKTYLDEPPIRNLSNATVVNEEPNAQSDKGRSVTDSGVETSASRSSVKSNRFPEDSTSLKKKMSVGFSETQFNPSDYLEIFVTMGTIELSLYTADDGCPEVVALRPSKKFYPVTRSPDESPVPKESQILKQEPTKTMYSEEEEMEGRRSNLSLTETVRNVDIGKTTLDVAMPLPYARRNEGNLPLVYVTFHQPNFYYWKKKSQEGFQVSLFNAWIGLGAGLNDNHWQAVLLSTARGEPDPVTDIPPALATMKLTLPSSGIPSSTSNSSISSRGSFRLDIERPVLLEISNDRLTRLKGIISLIQSKQLHSTKFEAADANRVPILHKVRRFMVHHSIENATVQTSQIGVIGPDGTAGWDSASLQVSWSGRPEKLGARALVTALLVASGPSNDARLPVLQPLQLGMELEATWEAWRRAEGGKSARHPTVRVGLEIDRVSIDARPSDLAVLNNIRETLTTLFSLDKSNSSESIEHVSMNNPASVSAKELNNQNASSMGGFDADCNDHYYKDDLRSGAFKIVSGSQLPMAYQVTLHRNSVSWRYPHPRAITRLIAFPLPGRDKEIDCVLELYNSILSQWEPHSYFKVPVNEPSEIYLHVAPPEAVFSTIWRFRVHSKTERRTPFEFNMSKFLPNIDTVITEKEPDKADPMGVSEVTAEELSGILRVDSYFAPQLLPLFRLSVRLTAVEVHVHNTLLSHYSKTSNLEGYYVSKPLMRSHRVVTFTARDAAAHGHFGCVAGKLILITTKISGDVMDCATGTMEQLVDEFKVQAAISMPREGLEHLRLRSRTSNIHAMLHVPRLRTLHALAIDWKIAFEESLLKSASSHMFEDFMEKSKLNKDVTTASLGGRVSLWVENCCASALRVGQEGTDEVVPLGPGATLAYRWRSPAAVRKLRFAFANPTADWHWSNSTSFTPGCSRVRMEDTAPRSSDARPVDGVYAYVKVVQTGANRYMHVSGRLILANMLRFNLHYKVRARSLETKSWRALTAGEIAGESVGRSVMCSVSCELVLKIKLTEQNSGWSGDIPLKECPKENVPWLVKVPSEGEVPYISVWCRVVRARSDGRILATIWPLYVLRSDLPLDTDVLIVSETNGSTSEFSDEDTKPAPMIQVAPGRGCNIHLLAPGTTSARHTLSFQYRNIECPVTREAVPLHYGVTDISVFDKRAPVNNITEVTQDVHAWLERSARTVTPSWPYSIVSKHWPTTWQPAQLQPRCDVTVRYQAVRAGGGCSLELRLSPVLLLCNASPIALTMRAHDASPLCKTEPGSAISLPSSMLQKPFFMSVETGRDTFVSDQLEVCSANPGRYGAPAPGQVAIEHSANFAIQCNQKVALLTLYYEIKEDINILGISSPYMLINRLDTDILVSPIAVPKDIAREVLLRTMSFKVVRTCPEGSIHGIPLCRFWLRDRWRGGNPTELNLFLCLALPLDSYPANSPVPVQLGTEPVRRALALIDSNNKSRPVVVIQHKHEGRWLVTVAPDPCPQFVVHNRTQIPLAVAQPVHLGDEPSSSSVTVVPDCSGVLWWCSVEQGAVTHYSSPAHCERYPSPTDSTVPLPFLTFARIYDDDHGHIWCSPVAVADGEQLVQLDSGNTVKLRIRTHPHSTLIELQDVDQHDISASDIRKRLVGPIYSAQTVASYDIDTNIQHDNKQLERVHGDNKLLESVGNRRRPSQQTLLIFSEASIGVPKLALTATQNNENKSTDSLKITNPEINQDGNLNTIEQKTVKDGNSNIKDLQVDTNQYPSTSSGAIEGKNLKTQQSKTVKDEIVNTKSTIATDENLKTKVSETVKDEIVNTESAIVPDENLKTKVSETVKDDTVNIDKQKLDADFADHGAQDNVNMFSSALTVTRLNPALDACSYIYQGNREKEWEDLNLGTERIRCVVASVALEMSVAGDTRPLFAVHLDRATIQISALPKKTKTTLSIADIQIDNLQYDSGQFDFAVVATTRAEPLETDQWPALWNMFTDRTAFATREKEARLLLKLTHDKWKVVSYKFNELTEFNIRLGPLALYVEDAYVTALIELFQLATPSAKASDLQSVLSEVDALQCPLRFRLLYIHPLDLTLTLHTAVRVYIALDQSPLHLSAFELRNMMTSTESLAHALTVHYLSAAILGAGWVVGGLELLGAPGALAARVGGATGGVRGIASAAAAALLRSLSAWAGSLARNLDLLAGDEEHARRAAAARRRPPDSLVAGLIAGITNFAINILGAVGGLAHHPLVGVAVGETESGAVALRRGLLGALTKPLSATADLVAYAGHGLLRQTGWDPVPQPRSSWSHRELKSAGWKRDCVRWTFRLAELSALAGFEVLLDNASLQLLLTHKFLVVADFDSERIVEMIDFRFCELRPYQGPIVELCVTQRRTPKTSESRGVDEDDEYQISAAAMARVARYTGAEGTTSAESRVLSLLPMPGQSHALYAALAAAIHHNADSHFALL